MTAAGITIEPSDEDGWASVTISKDGQMRRVLVPRGSIFPDRPRCTTSWELADD